MSEPRGQSRSEVVGPKLAQSRPRVGPKSAQSRLSVGSESAQSRPKVGQKWAQGRPKVGPKSAQGRPRVGPRSASSRPRVGPRLASSQPRVGLKSPQSRPKVRSKLTKRAPWHEYQIGCLVVRSVAVRSASQTSGRKIVPDRQIGNVRSGATTQIKSTQTKSERVSKCWQVCSGS